LLTRPNCAFLKPANDAGFLVYEVQIRPFHPGSNAHHQLRFIPGVRKIAEIPAVIARAEVTPEWLAMKEAKQREL
jgi:hypothetical protein